MPIDLFHERSRTRPDYVVYTPGSVDGSTCDTGNEHFFVFDGPDHSLLAVWTQSTHEHQPDHRAVIARSDDGGVSWSEPRRIAGTDALPASWVFPVVTTSGRIYAFYHRKSELSLGPARSPRTLSCRYSDDAGRTWSQEGIIPVPRTQWDSPDPAKVASWLVWQRPQRLPSGKVFAGITRWVSKDVVGPNPIKSWVADAAVVSFVRFENIDDCPEPDRVELTWIHSGDDALKVGMEGFPDHSVAQEPSVVALPDGRLFCVMRTIAGSPYYTVSDDAGATWSVPDVLRLCDDGEPLLHPLSPCPIYATAQGDYFMMIHNHGRWRVADGNLDRNPLYILRGEFRPGARQPIWFSRPQLFMDTADVSLGYGKGVNGLAMYSSVTYRGGETTLWYPDRKFFLLGKVVQRAMLDALAIEG